MPNLNKAGGGTNMNATQLLMVDHEEAMTMLDALVAGELSGGVTETAEMKANNVQLFERLKEALKQHTSIEEQIFYPALESFDETKELIKKSHKEHEEVDELLRQMIPGEADWEDQVAELKRKVEHHAEEEEREVFPKAEQLLGEEELLRMGQEIQALKGEKSSTTAVGAKVS
jgi:iron-sulfur cluster repair protein YtfE (RIC family)